MKHVPRTIHTALYACMSISSATVKNPCSKLPVYCRDNMIAGVNTRGAYYIAPVNAHKTIDEALFNEVLITIKCPTCNVDMTLDAQFWLTTPGYRAGVNKINVRSIGEIAGDEAYSEPWIFEAPCPHCKEDHNIRLSFSIEADTNNKERVVRDVSAMFVTPSDNGTPVDKTSDILRCLEEYCLFEKRFSQQNIKSILERAKKIARYHDISSICLEEARRIEMSMRRKNLKPSTIGNMLYVLEYIAWSQGKDLKLIKPKRVHRRTEFLTVEEVYALIKVCDTPRDRAIIGILAYTGMRSKELLALHVTDIDLDSRIIYIRDHGEGMKNYHERTAIIPRPLEKIIRKHLATRNTGNESLFPSRSGNALTGKGLQYMIRKYGVKAGIDKNVHPHMLRHTTATLMCASGINIALVQQQLGHKDLKSTMVYSHVNDDILRKAIDEKLNY